MDEKRLLKAADRGWLKSKKRNLTPGRLVSPYDVTGRPGYKYVNKGEIGDQGLIFALDKVGIADIANQRVGMLWEDQQWVIREAEQYAGGGGGGATTLAGLSDVDIPSPADGDALQYSASSSKWINVVPAGGSGGAPSPHDRDSAHHTGLEAWANIDKSGSDLDHLATKNHNDLDNIGANDHHNQVHVLATNSALGADHTISGATAGQVLRALGATTAAFAQLQHNDLGGVTANQHHNQVHGIVGSDHTVTGSALDVVGLSGTNTLGVLTPSANPGATAAILRTSSNGSLQLDTNLFHVNASSDLVTIDTNLLYADAGNNRIGINKTPGNAALDVIAAANADHTQRLKQKSGQTGRLWRIENVAGDELIVLDSQGNLQSGMPGFVSGLTGWQITPTGTAEFNNVWVRGELHATVFVKDEIHATGGTMLVATAGKLYADADIDVTTQDVEPYEAQTTVSGYGTYHEAETTVGGYGQYHESEAVLNFIDVEDPPSGPGLYFQRGDVVRSKTEVPTGVTDFWLEVKHARQMTDFGRYSVIKRSGTDGILPAGSAVVSYGQEGDGRVLLTSDLNYAPYIDVFTVGPNVWTGAAGAQVPHVRIGRLDGVGVTAVSGIKQYGMIAGTDLSNANSPYIVASNLQLRLHKVDLTANDGTNDTVEITATGNLTLGTNIATTNGKSFQVISTGADAGDVIIGRIAGNYLKWDQSAATLTINGSLQVGGAGVATTSYVDTAESDAISAAAADATTKANTAISTASADATSKANAALTDAQTYANQRRVLGVSGTWTSTDADTITWSGVSVRLADGNTKSISNGNTGNMAATTYLYVDPAATAPLTLSATTTMGSLPAGYTLIAVAIPGADKATVIVTGGTTFISGDNISTGSIVAANIKTGTITSTQINTAVFTTISNEINAAQSDAENTAAADATTKANAAQSAAESHADTLNSYRALGVTGTFTPTDIDTVSWTSASVRKANGTTITISNGNTGNMAAQTWLYILHNATSPATMQTQTSLASIPANAIIIGVATPGVSTGSGGAGVASIMLLPGRTLITGDQIVTGSIVTANIKAGAITANEINVGDLNSVSSNTGALTVTGNVTVGTLGAIFSSGKTYGGSTAGFFLGYSSGAYKFDIGNDDDYVRWDGTTMRYATTTQMSITNNSTGRILAMNGTGVAHTLDLIGDVLSTTANFHSDFITCEKIILNDDTIQIKEPRTIAAWNSTGNQGEWCWDLDFLYIAIANNFWRKIPLPTTTW